MPPSPSPETVHVWTAALDGQDEAGLFRLLAADERGRADKFHFRRDRFAFVAARGWMRTVLAGYLGRGPERVRFGYGSGGKPYLRREAGDPDLRFNLSHSDGRAAMAVATSFEVGLDIERIRPVEDGLAARFFAPGEVAALAGLPPGPRLAAFFAAWTRKEAYVKALGGGLGIALDGFEVALLPGWPPAILAVAGDPAEASRWQVAEIDAGPDFAGALAARALGWRVVMMNRQGTAATLPPGPGQA